MTRTRRILLGVGATIGSVILLGGVLIGGILWHTLPPTSQTLHLAGLQHPVSITIDEHGIPRIDAGDLVDAAVATGFMHARDRMFEMELMRHVGSGRVSELAGPAGLPIDRMMRTLGLRRLAEAAYPMLPKTTRDLLDGYARGVNAAIAARGRFISPEFLLIGAPEPWTPADSLLWGRLMGLSLAENWRTELARLATPAHVAPDRLLKLRPDHAETPSPEAARADPALSRLASRLADALPRFPAPYTLPEEASDEWAVDGAHSRTGAPLLAGDPHLAFGFPSIWYLVRIAVPGHVLTGASAPGVPFLVIGQNGHIAWTFTSSSADCQDLFIETPLPDGRYATPTGPQPFQTRDERIHVRGAPDIVMTIRTTRHGPVISDILRGSSGGQIIAAAMENLRPEDAAPGLAALDVADDIDAAGRAAALISTPVQNLLVADRRRIALFTTGEVPIRRSGDGSVASDGADGLHDWIGHASGTALPTIVSPSSGRILNGNERTAPPGFPVFMGRDWPAPWRASRIRTLLDAAPTHDIDDFVRMQNDPTSAFAQHLLPLLLGRPLHVDPASLQFRALSLLRGWDGSMDPVRPQPLIFNAWIQRFVGDVLAREGVPAGAAGSWEDVADLLLGPAGSAWCGSDCTPMLAAALDTSMHALAPTQGADPAGWRWGTVHHAMFDNAVLRAIPLVGAIAHRDIPIGGDDSTLLRGGSGLLGDFQAVHGASYRGDYDLADPERSRFIVAPGQSGNWLSGNAWNLMQLWAGGSSMTIGHSARRVDATISLLPAGG